VPFGTQTVGFLKLAIFGLRAIEHPARAVALTTVIHVAGERMAQASEFLDTIKSIHIYREPSDAFVKQMKQAASTLIAKSKFSGFNRLPAAAAPEPAS
jgi:hypothetical protein